MIEACSPGCLEGKECRVRQLSPDHIATLVADGRRAARDDANATSLASEAVRLARVATAIHLASSAHRSPVPPLQAAGREDAR